ncbi:MAG: 4-hydroxy-tetrahydrodipicolinate synthase [Clostridia bacterium]|nr:4-hydroxy-tetrahydrodipicolinate synthase [Clostridia bacterium]
MEKQSVFCGSATALVTPFHGGTVDFEALDRIIEFQIDGGSDALVICGSTGEVTALRDSEKRALIAHTVERTAGRLPVIAGTSSADTAYAVSLSRYAEEVGADALLLATPYYSKPTPRGLIESFSAIADAVKLPCILYNVPSRTGVTIPMSVYRELVRRENIVAVKEAGGCISTVAEIAAEFGDVMDIYCGNDDQTVPILALGGKGVISVMSNIIPRETHEICRLWFEGKVEESRRLQLDNLDLAKAIFIETNPIPIKAAMAMMGLCSDEMRLPLCAMEEEHIKRLGSVLRRHALI